MVWFKQKKSEKLTITEQLKTLLSDGVNLSIQELLAYQHKTSLINLAPKQALHGSMSGNYLARSKGHGMEFDEVRHYQVGDDIRTIDWRVTARTGITHTKIFREEVERPVIIATDLNHTMFFGSQLLFKSVQAAHVASLLAWHSKQRGDRVGGIVFNEKKHVEIKPRSRQQGVLHYLHALCELHKSPCFNHESTQQDNSTPNSTSNIEQSSIETLHVNDADKEVDSTSKPNKAPQRAFEQNCARIRQVAKPGALVYLITDAYQLDESCIKHLSLISQHCELVVCLISDPLEKQLPNTAKAATVAMTDGVNQQTIRLGDKKSAKQYQQLSEQLSEQKKQLFTKAGARILTFSAASPLEQQIKDGIKQWTR